MGEEVKSNDDGVSEWEAGLPSPADLTPLSQSLIPAELASAFKISPEPPRTALDVTRASRTTISSLRSAFSPSVDEPEPEPEEASEAKKSRGADDPDEQSTAKASASASKRARLVWTPQLHKRFVDVVAHLGLKNAVPKTIMQLMNVEGLTRENVASHLQKYRLYVKRMQGLSNEGPSPSDHLFASTPLPPQSFNDSSNHGNNESFGNNTNNSNNNVNSNSNNHGGMPIPMLYPHPPQQIMPTHMMGQGHGFHGYESHNHHYHHQQQQQQRDWSGNKFNGYPHHLTQK